jgi:hypothetical protein
MGLGIRKLKKRDAGWLRLRDCVWQIVRCDTAARCQGLLVRNA